MLLEDDSHWMRRYDESDPSELDDYGMLGSACMLVAASIIVAPAVLILSVLDRFRHR